MSAGRVFDPPTTIRVKAAIAARIKQLADLEGNTEAAVLRRALAAGLDVIDPTPEPVGGPDRRAGA
jgi:Ribbon-helix-helix protein, copG family